MKKKITNWFKGFVAAIIETVLLRILSKPELEMIISKIIEKKVDVMLEELADDNQALVQERMDHWVANNADMDLFGEKVSEWVDENAPDAHSQFTEAIQEWVNEKRVCVVTKKILITPSNLGSPQMLRTPVTVLMPTLRVG